MSKMFFYSLNIQVEKENTFKNYHLLHLNCKLQIIVLRSKLDIRQFDILDNASITIEFYNNDITA